MSENVVFGGDSFIDIMNSLIEISIHLAGTVFEQTCMFLKPPSGFTGFDDRRKWFRFRLCT
jgi:hypothetical protein